MAVKDVAVLLYSVVSTAVSSPGFGFFLYYTNDSCMSLLCNLLITSSCICNCYTMNIALSFHFSDFKPFLKHLSLCNLQLITSSSIIRFFFLNVKRFSRQTVY